MWRIIKHLKNYIHKHLFYTDEIKVWQDIVKSWANINIKNYPSI